MFGNRLRGDGMACFSCKCLNWWNVNAFCFKSLFVCLFYSEGILVRQPSQSWTRSSAFNRKTVAAVVAKLASRSCTGCAMTCWILFLWTTRRSKSINAWSKWVPWNLWTSSSIRRSTVCRESSCLSEQPWLTLSWQSTGQSSWMRISATHWILCLMHVYPPIGRR